MSNQHHFVQTACHSQTEFDWVLGEVFLKE
jgi:hypothetical protein